MAVFLVRRGILCKMSPMCLCQWRVLSNYLLIGFRGCGGETVGVDGAVGTVCLAGLVGVVGGNFGEMVLWVGVGWLVLRLCFGLFLLRGSWSGVGSLTSFQLCGRGHDPRKNQVLRLGILPIFPKVLIHLPVLFWARLWLFLDRILWIFELHFGVNLQEFFCGSGSGTPVNSCTHLWWSDATGQAWRAVAH